MPMPVLALCPWQGYFIYIILFIKLLEKCCAKLLYFFKLSLANRDEKNSIKTLVDKKSERITFEDNKGQSDVWKVFTKVNVYR